MNETGLRKNTLGLFSLVFFVVAAASPLTGVVGGLPVAIISGNGGGIPVFYILSCLILLLFAVRFIAMSRYVSNAGAFYTYISAGLGENWGASASVLALMAYVSVQIAIVAMLGFFTQLFLADHLQLTIPWWALSMLFALVAWMLSIKRVEVGGKLLGVLMLAEVAIVLLTDVMLLIKKAGPYNFQSFDPALFMHGNLGIAFIFTLAAFIGFESTAIYAEECRHLHKIVQSTTLCILVLQLGVSAAVILFFRRRHERHSPLQVFWAPLASMLCMGITIILVINNLQSLSGSDSEIVRLIPWLIAACALAGYGLSLKRGVRADA